MGMFDYVQFGDLRPTIEVLLDEKVSEHRDKNLPKDLFSEEGAQTKSLDCCLQTFVFRKDELANKYQLFVKPGDFDNYENPIFCDDVLAMMSIGDVVYGDEWDVWYDVKVPVNHGVVDGKIVVTKFNVTDAKPRIENSEKLFRDMQANYEYSKTLKGRLHRLLTKWRRKLGKKIVDLGNFIQWGK